jgi:hypothetical protein
MNGSARINQILTSDSTPERQAQDVRAWAWAFVFECWHNKKGAHDDMTTSKPSHTGNGITNNETGEN